MQADTQGVFPSKARIFLADRGSEELSSRAKGREEMCGMAVRWLSHRDVRWLCHSSECGATL